MVDVFISYSRANQDVVRRLADAIGKLGYVVWWDEELPAHLSYGEVITQKIGEAKATLVVWSRESAASEWVRAEADMARNQKTLIQTAIDDCTPPLPFNQIQYAAIGDWTGADDHPGWRKAKASLAALCGTAPAEAGPSVPEPVAAARPVIAAAPAPAAPIAPRVVVPARRSRTQRLAFVAIAASVMTILSVGGLVLLKGPPTAQATAAPAPAVPPPAAAAPAPAPAALPPKTGVIEAHVQSADEGLEGQEAESAGDAADGGEGDY